MVAPKLNCFFLFLFALVTLIPALTAHGNREFAEAEKLDGTIVLDRNTTQGFTVTHKQISNNNSSATRRELSKRVYKGPCLATNPIDRCWRCNPNWANNRKRLADCALGFGRGAIGGKYGMIYVVSSPSDKNAVAPTKGTLRHAVIQKKPLWIIFARSMTITLTQPLMMQSYKTIDGRGVSVNIAYGAGITVQNSHNIIIHNIHIHNIIPTGGGVIRDSTRHFGIRTHDDGDGISLFSAKDIWLDHLSMTRCADGLIDAIEGSTGITISNSHFTDHDKAMLFGARDDNPIDEKMQVTIAFNHFGKRMMQRMPRCRSGFFHLVNNDYTHWNMYAIGGSSHATIISQGNRFVAQTNLAIGQEYKKEITHRDGGIPVSVWSRWTWVSDKDIFVNGAHFTPSGDLNGARTYAALELIKAAPGTMVKDITKFSGYLGCIVGRPC